MSLLAHEIVHFLVGLGTATCVTKGIKLRLILPWIVFSTLFIDADHLLDYLQTIGLRWDVNAFVSGSYFVTSKRVIVFLHSWELALLLVFIGWQSRKSNWSIPLLGIGLGMFVHLLVDQIWYKQPIGTYFLILRMLHDFTDPSNW